MLTTTLQLDYSAILAHTARPIHLALTFHAGGGQARPMPVAFVAVIDRSGSMSGPPIQAAKAAARLALRNLRPGDHFGVVVFDSSAEVALPLMEAGQAQAQAHVIDAIEACASTNLAAGWCLGRDQLLASPAGMPRRLLLLSDGLLNQGVTEPAKVRQLAVMGLEIGQIRTSCLGFGDGYNEDLMEAMALGSGGMFHDANNPEKLPVIFGKELDGLQNVVVQNLRVTLRPSALLESCRLMGDYPQSLGAGGGPAYALGDLVAGEQRVAVAELGVLPIPSLPNGAPAATWDGEHLLDVEIACDLIGDEGLTLHRETHPVKVRAVQNPGEVVVNTEVLPWVTLQQASAVVAEAMAARDQGDLGKAFDLVDRELARLQALPRSPLVEDAQRLLRLAREGLANADYDLRSRKSLKGLRTLYSRFSTVDETAHEAAELPSFKKMPPPPAPSGQPGPTNPTPQA